MHDMRHMDFLADVTKMDIETLRKKEATYRGSWKKRGGIGAFIVGLTRKWDRLENMMEFPPPGLNGCPKYDIFAACLNDTSGADGTPLAELRDLRQYLLLIEAHIQSVIAGGKNLVETDFERDRIPEKVYARAHGDSAHAAEFQVPREDSNRHATNDDWWAGSKVSGEWKVKPIISADLYRRLQDPDLKARYVLTGAFAHVDRRLYAEAERLALFKPMPQTHTKMSFERLGIAEKEFYEPRTGVEGEWQMKKEFREVWGA